MYVECCTLTAAVVDLCSTSLEWQQSERNGGGGWGGETHTNPPVRWSCLRTPCLDKPHQKHISPLFSHPLAPLPPPQCLSLSLLSALPSFIPPPLYNSSRPGHAVLDTQPGKRGAMMNCSLLVLSMMIIINFPIAFAREWGPECCSVAAPPPWAFVAPTIITYQRQSLGSRLNADENEKLSSWYVLFFVHGFVYAVRYFKSICSLLCPFFFHIVNPP